MEGDPGEPIVSIAGHAEVRDTNLQANAERYIAKRLMTTCLTRRGRGPGRRSGTGRDHRGHNPGSDLWWDNATAMDSAPHRWDAPADTAYPIGPRPSGELSKTPQWSQPSWRQQAQT